MEAVVALVALVAMEIVLGIDNIVFLAILTGRLPEHQQPTARRIGLALALVMRLGLLFAISWVLSLTQPLFHIPSIDFLAVWMTDEVREVSMRDLILLAGGLFLIWKSVYEIHHKLEGPDEAKRMAGAATFWGVIVQVVVLDIVFSLDSVITAVGMVDPDKLWIMVVAIVAAVVVMLIFAEPVSRFVSRHATLKVLALSFLILIGVMLVAEGIGTHMHKGYIYFAMAFALAVELINLRVRSVADRSAASAPKTN